MKNKVGGILRIIGFGIIIIGSILALQVISQTNSLSIGAGFFFEMFVTGMVFIGFAEVINLLNSINYKMGPDGNVDNEQVKKETLPLNTQNPAVAARDEKEIVNFYAARNKAVDKIIHTPYQDYYIVNVDGNSVLVELGGFNPVEYQESNWPGEIREWHKDNHNS